MSITIHGKEYKLNMSFSALIRFVGAHKVSVHELFSKFGDNETTILLIRLLYDGIIGIDMTFEDFRVYAGADDMSFNSTYLSALKYAKELVHINPVGGKTSKSRGGSNKNAEMSILSMAVASGIDTGLMDILPMSGVCDLILEINSVKSGKQEKKFYKLASDEISKMYTGEL